MLAILVSMPVEQKLVPFRCLDGFHDLGVVFGVLPTWKPAEKPTIGRFGSNNSDLVPQHRTPPPPGAVASRAAPGEVRMRYNGKGFPKTKSPEGGRFHCITEVGVNPE